MIWATRINALTRSTRVAGGRKISYSPTHPTPFTLAKGSLVPALLRRERVSPRIQLFKPFVPRLHMPKLGEWNRSRSRKRKRSGQCEICDRQCLPDRDAVGGQMVV